MANYLAEVLKDHPLAFWRMNETAGHFADSSGNDYTAYAFGVTTYAAAPILPGLPGDAAPYWTADASTAVAYQTTGAGFETLDHDFTVECWLAATEAPFGGLNAAVLTKNPGTDASEVLGVNGWLLEAQTSLPIPTKLTIRWLVHQARDNPAFPSGQSTESNWCTFGPTIPTAAGPNHVVARYRAAGGPAPRWVDLIFNGLGPTTGISAGIGNPGVPANTADAPIRVAVPTTYPDQTLHGYQGRLSHVAYYDYALPDARAYAHYQAGSTAFVPSGRTNVWYAIL